MQNFLECGSRNSSIEVKVVKKMQIKGKSRLNTGNFNVISFDLFGFNSILRNVNVYKTKSINDSFFILMELIF